MDIEPSPVHIVKKVSKISLSMQDLAREVRLSLGRPSSHATRQQALQQVAMLRTDKRGTSISESSPLSLFPPIRSCYRCVHWSLGQRADN